MSDFYEADRISWIGLRAVELPLARAVSDAKVATGRQQPLDAVSLLIVELQTQQGHAGLGFSYSLRTGGPAQYIHARELAPLLLGERFQGGSEEQRCTAFIDELAALNERCGLPSRLRDAGVPEAMLPTLASDAMLQQRLLVNNPREMTEADVLAIYEEAF